MTSTEVLHTEQSYIQKTPNVCGGDACIGYTRIPVWSLVVASRLGKADAELLDYFVTPLSLADVGAVGYCGTVTMKSTGRGTRAAVSLEE